MAASPETLQPLVDLGFNALEAEIYAFLLAESPATGYRVAQAIGKPAANTYKAIESLVGKGAALVDDGESRHYRAVPPEELLSRLGRRFEERRKRALSALSRLKPATGDDRVYQLRSAESVFERARRMLAGAKRVVLLDLFPESLEALRPDVEAAAARGLDVAVKAYAPAAVKGATVVLTALRDVALERWPGQWLNVVVDGSEHLLALLAPGGGAVHHAVWSGSAYVSWVYHCAFVAEIFMSDVERRVAEGASIDAVRRTLSAYRKHVALDAPGYSELLRRFSPASPRAPRARRPARKGERP
jgi:sugar-specific transcriptional regulator TrmB